MEIAKTKRNINQKAINELLLLLDLFLKTNASDKELSEKTGISSSTVGRRLVDEELMVAAFPSKSEEEIHEIYLKVKELRQKNLATAKVLGGQHSILNNVFLRSERGNFMGSGKINLKIFSNSKEYQDKILWHIAHTFSLHPDTLSSIFNLDATEIRAILIKTRPEFSRTHEYLCMHDITDQITAKKNFLEFYNQFLNAVKTKNMVRKKELLDYLTDAEFMALRQKRKNQDPNILSEEELKIMLRQHFKYALTYRHIATFYNVSVWTYRYSLDKYLRLPENVNLKQCYLALSNFNFESRGDFNVRRI